VAELVDARDLKFLATTPNQLESQESDGKQNRAKTPKRAANQPVLENISGFGFSVKRVRARGRRYAYIRGTDIPLVRGFDGTDSDFEPAIVDAAQAHVDRVTSAIDGWRMDAARDIHKVTKARASRRGLAYTLTAEGIADTLSTLGDRCELTGLPFDCEKKIGSEWMRRPMAPSLDRKDNQSGYEPWNLRIVCTCVNIAINEWGLANFEQVCRAFVTRTGGEACR
jgi:hypothetical protein